MASPRTLRDLSLRPVSVLETVSARKAAQLGRVGRRVGARPVDDLPAGRYIDRTAKADVSGLEVGDEAAVLAEVQRVRSSGGAQPAAPIPSPSPCATRPGRWRWSSSTSPGGPSSCAEGTEAIFWGKVGDYRGARQMVNPVVDVVAGVDEPVVGPAAAHLADPARLPGLGQGRAHQLGDRHLRGGGARAGRASSSTRCPRSGATSLDLWDRTAAMRAIHGPESMDVIAPARRRLIFDELFRLQLALVLRRRAFEHNARALRHERLAREITGAVERHAGRPFPRRRCPSS